MASREDEQRFGRALAGRCHAHRSGRRTDVGGHGGRAPRPLLDGHAHQARGRPLRRERLVDHYFATYPKAANTDGTQVHGVQEDPEEHRHPRTPGC